MPLERMSVRLWVEGEVYRDGRKVIMQKAEDLSDIHNNFYVKAEKILGIQVYR